ncbi:MAG: hypothetical protein PHF60_03860 [Candidatus ainarchaeum sp.]|nr:hypothetical protein [Candidatus ainarchaeum sp.]
MKRLEHGQSAVAARTRDAATSRPLAYKLTSPLLVGLLAIGAPAAIMTISNKAVAQEIEICGRKVEVVKLDKTVAQMDRETAPFRGAEAMPENSVSGGYINSVTVPGKITFGISSERDKWFVVVAFPKGLDKTGITGTRSIDLTDFADYVEKLSGQKMERAYIILELGTFEYQGKNIEYVTAHIYPLNEKGQFITRMKNGDLTYDVSYYAGETYGGESLLVESAGRRSAIAKQEFIIARN